MTAGFKTGKKADIVRIALSGSWTQAIECKRFCSANKQRALSALEDGWAIELFTLSRIRYGSFVSPTNPSAARCNAFVYFYNIPRVVKIRSTTYVVILTSWWCTAHRESCRLDQKRYTYGVRSGYAWVR